MQFLERFVERALRGQHLSMEKMQADDVEAPWSPCAVNPARRTLAFSVRNRQDSVLQVFVRGTSDVRVRTECDLDSVMRADA